MNTPAAPLVEARGLVKHFPVRRGLLRRTVGWVRAVDGVSLEVREGETLALVGESGCGKTTLGRMLAGLAAPTQGIVKLGGEDLSAAPRGRLRRLRRDLQIIFQDPFGSLNPRWTVEAIVGEGLVNLGVASAERRDRIALALRKVGLDPQRHLARYPHEFSGGQRQRIGIARALVVHPRFVVCDEVVSSLDVSVRAQILNLLLDLQAESGHAYLFISHDLSVVRHIADRVAVMYLGRIVEEGPARAICEAPHHPYTRALLEAAPAVHPRERKERRPLGDDLPSPLAPPPGCRFHTRCSFRMDRCSLEEPPPLDVAPGHASRCFLPAEPGGTPQAQQERGGSHSP